jgi:hypothetical protein
MSKKDPWYKQCKYRTDLDESGSCKEGVSWIPENLAKIGNRIYFGKKTATPTELWTVISVGSRQKESFLVEHRMDYKHQRKVSDV